MSESEIKESEVEAYRAKARARGNQARARGNQATTPTTPPKPTKANRFAPMNALVESGWLGCLTGRQVKVWSVLYKHANNEGKVRIGHACIAKCAGIHREDAARTTKQLERAGVIKCIHRGRTMGQAGKRESNEYQLLATLPTLPHLNSGASTTIERIE